eukprot:TRINITY_DN10126_c0_g1_i13.p1 TRINITY_DN10126_c0_g1~~TRINITY_DN10126_c0_g1_i13.p1  ORF type:complete len:350 (-),score=69.81 TRINITY_DN10126_c0_g1_i13:93-1142(-)
MCIRDRYSQEGSSPQLRQYSSSSTVGPLRITKKFSFISHRLNRSPLEPSPMPGSLEENCERPEGFLEANSPPNKANPQCKFSPTKSRMCLNPTDIYKYAAEVAERHKRAELQDSKEFHGFLLKRLFPSANPSAQASRKLAKKDAKDEDIAKAYKEADKRIGVKLFSTASQFSTRSIVQQFQAIKQSRFFETYNDSQRYLDRYYKNVKLAIGRKPPESLLSRSNAYREKVERLSTKQSGAVASGYQGWYLSLRQTPGSKDRREPVVPLGRTYDGLWMRVVDTINAPAVTIRRPECYTVKSLDNSGGEGLDGEGELVAMGRSAYRVEIEGFRKCNKQKVIIREEEDSYGSI